MKHSEKLAKHISNMVDYHNAYNLLCDIYRDLMNNEEYKKADDVKACLLVLEHETKRLGECNEEDYKT